MKRSASLSSQFDRKEKRFRIEQKSSNITFNKVINDTQSFYPKNINFSPCHLSMLQALYCHSEESNKSSSFGVEDRLMWDRIKHFFIKRDDLLASKSKAAHLRGILNEEAVVSKRTKNRRGARISINHRDTPQTPVLSFNKVSLSFTTQTQHSVTSPSKPSLTTENFSPFSFHSNFHRYQDFTDYETSDGVKSLNLVTKIIKKQCIAVDIDSEREKKPFSPLIEAVKSRIKELEHKLDLLVKEGQSRSQEDKIELFLDDVLKKQSIKYWDYVPNETNVSSSIKIIAELQSKLWLWSLLANDLIDSIE